MDTAHIRTQFDTDEQNRKAVYSSVGAASLLPDSVVGLYERQHALLAGQLSDYPAEVAASLYVTCRMHLVLGITSLFHRYSAQAFRETRAAVESAGIAAAIRRDAQSFRIFLDDNDEVSRGAARKHFKSSMLFGRELSPLKTYYDKASELSHSNRRTFGVRLNVEEQIFSYQDLREQDIPQLAINYLIWICSAHLTILEMADIVFPEAKGDLVTKFRAERQYLAERIGRFDFQNRSDLYEPNAG